MNQLMKQSKENPLILIVGGTGTQGGNAARELLAHGHRIRILTRNPESRAAKHLEEAGAEIIKGDMADISSLEPAMTGVSAVFSAQYSDPKDPSVEIRNSNNMVQAAQKAGVSQIVHTSVSGSNLFPRWTKYDSLIEYWDHKYEIEESIRQGGFKYWTILHPCWFMENYAEPSTKVMAPELSKGVLFGILDVDAPLKLNCGEDTAKFARAAFESPERFHEKDINVAGEELTMPEIADTIGRVLGREIRYEQVSIDEAVKRGLMLNTCRGLEWMNEVRGFGFDLKETLEYGIELKTFEQWLLENKVNIK